MSFPVKPWQDEPSHETPVDAVALRDLEERLAAWSEAKETEERERAETAEALKLAKASNLSDLASAPEARTHLGLGTAATEPKTAFAAPAEVTTERERAEAAETTKLAKASNLADLASAPEARTHLGLGTAAVEAKTAFDVAGEAATEKARAEAAETLAESTSKAQALTALERARLSVRGAGEVTAAQSTQRENYEAEEWLDKLESLASWTLGEAESVRVSEGKLYGKKGGSKCWASRAFPVAPGETGAFRVAFQVNVKGEPLTATGLYLGVSKGTPGSLSEAALVGIDLHTRTAKYKVPGTEVPAEISGAPALTEGVYTVTIEGDAECVSFTWLKEDRSVELHYRMTRAEVGSVTRVFLYIAVLESAEASKQSYVGPYVGAKSARATMSAASRANVEGIGVSRSIWTKDASGTGLRCELPGAYDSRRPPVGIILPFHSGQVTAGEPVERVAMLPMFKKLAESGFVIAGSDGASNGWGTLATVEAAQRLYRYLRERGTLAPIVLLSSSAGGTALAVALHRQAIPNVVGAIYVSSPYNIEYLHGHTSASETPIEEAYGLNTEWSNFAAQVTTPGLEPKKLLEEDPWPYVAIPWYMSGSTEDTVIPLAHEGEPFAAALEEHGGTVTKHFGAYGEHLAEAQFPAEAIASFALSCVQT